MDKDLRIVALIPARGQSKQLPQKNVLSLRRVSLIRWSIAAAHATTLIDTVIMRTNDPSNSRIVNAIAHEFDYHL
ncbi:MAG: hypothetical protein RLZZ519_2780 [Bacteroidota bacterium]|jgi:CMP-N,N'-diacetyllegionaminic acid synthase